MKQIMPRLEVSERRVVRHVPVLTYGLSYQKMKKTANATVMKLNDADCLSTLAACIGMMSLIGMRKKPPRAGSPKEFFSRNDTLNFLDPSDDTHGVTLVFFGGKVYISIRHGRLVAGADNVEELKVYGVTRFDDDSVNAIGVTVGVLFVKGEETLEIRDVDGFTITAAEIDVDNPHIRTVARTEEEYNSIETLVREYYS